MSDEYIKKQTAIDAIMGEHPDAHYPSWFAKIIHDIPPEESKYSTEGDEYEQSLKDCPFCGGRPKYIRIFRMDMIYCDNCWCIKHAHGGRAHLRAMWNMRPKGEEE